MCPLVQGVSAARACLGTRDSRSALLLLHGFLAARWLVFPFAAFRVGGSTAVVVQLTGGFCAWALLTLVADWGAVVYISDVADAPSPSERPDVGRTTQQKTAAVAWTLVWASTILLVTLPALGLPSAAVAGGAAAAIALLASRRRPMDLYYSWAALDTLWGLVVVHSLAYGGRLLVLDSSDRIEADWLWFWRAALGSCACGWLALGTLVLALLPAGAGGRDAEGLPVDVELHPMPPQGDAGHVLLRGSRSFHSALGLSRSSRPRCCVTGVLAGVVAAYSAGLLAAAAGFAATAAWPPGELPGGQHSPAECRGCYCSAAFPAEDVESARGVPFGQAEDWRHQQGLDLLLDVYRARGLNDSVAPAVLIIHGGGFWKGARNSSIVVTEAVHLARHGFVAFVMDYRLEGVQGLPPTSSVRDAVFDAKAAVRFLVRHAASYGVDPDRIAAWGTSAGAIIAATMNSVPEEGHSGSSGYPSNVTASVGISGTLWPFLLAGGGDRREQAASTPWLDVHGDRDLLVPSFLAPMTYLFRRAWGAPAAANRLLWVPGGGHEPWTQPARPGEQEPRALMRPHIQAFLVQWLGLAGKSCPWHAGRQIRGGGLLH